MTTQCAVPLQHNVDETILPVLFETLSRQHYLAVLCYYAYSRNVYLDYSFRFQYLILKHMHII